MTEFITVEKQELMKDLFEKQELMDKSAEELNSMWTDGLVNDDWFEKATVEEMKTVLDILTKAGY